MTYQEAVAKLYNLSGELAPATAGTPRRKFDLEHMRSLAAALGHPEQKYPSVLIAGTNGKGSTASTLASILAVSGYRTGLYTSPHLLRVNERIQISSRTPGENTLVPISDDAFAHSFQRVDEAAARLVANRELPHTPSFFEVVTAVAFCAFAEAGIDIAILEVGLGGRLDATNIVQPLVSVITDIALDHTEWLGNTLGEIAREKAGILRPNGLMVTLPQHPEANIAIGEVAVALDVTGINAAEYLPERTAGDEPYPIILRSGTITVNSPLHGEHQRRNLALAIATADQISQNKQFKEISPQSIATGITATRWPGRLELVTRNQKQILLDVAHNPAGAWTLRSFLSRHMDDGSLPAPRTLIFSALRDKSIREMAQILFPLFEELGDRILLAPIHSSRAASSNELQTIAAELETAVIVCSSVEEAMQLAISGAGSIVVSGSVYLVGEAKAWLEQQA